MEQGINLFTPPHESRTIAPLFYQDKIGSRVKSKYHNEFCGARTKTTRASKFTIAENLPVSHQYLTRVRYEYVTMAETDPIDKTIDDQIFGGCFPIVIFFLLNTGLLFVAVTIIGKLLLS